MNQTAYNEIARGCTHFLAGHYPRTVRQRLEDIAGSAYADFRADSYGAGGFVSQLEEEIATLLGKEAAVFMPSGTMAQQIALRIWADGAGVKTVAFHPMCHLQTHEHMAYRELHGMESVLLGTPDRLFTLEDLQAVEGALSSLLIELPQRDLGGQLPTWEELGAITSHARSRGFRLHLDGARLWQCGPYYGRPYHEIAAGFDSVYVSFYKILQGLPGAALAGPADFIAEARIWMRRQGGNLSAVFPNAIAAKVGMDRHLPRIPEYVDKAREVAAILNELDGVTVVPRHPPTNMMHLHFAAAEERLLEAAAHVAAREKCLLIPRLVPSGTGSMIELSIGNAGVEICGERIRSQFAEVLELAGR